jgi:hypothetical protein
MIVTTLEESDAQPFRIGPTHIVVSAYMVIARRMRLYSGVKNEPTARENGAEKWARRKQQPTYADERSRR